MRSASRSLTPRRRSGAIIICIPTGSDPSIENSQFLSPILRRSAWCCHHRHTHQAPLILGEPIYSFRITFPCSFHIIKGIAKITTISYILIKSCHTSDSSMLLQVRNIILIVLPDEGTALPCKNTLMAICIGELPQSVETFLFCALSRAAE